MSKPIGRRRKADSEALRNRAYELFMNTSLTMAEIADAVGVGKDTISDWSTRFSWRQTKAANSVTREKNISMTLVQISNLQDEINRRPKGQQYPTSMESDTLLKMTKIVRDLSNKTSLPDYFNVCQELLKHLHLSNNKLAADVSDYVKEFLQNKARELER